MTQEEKEAAQAALIAKLKTYNYKELLEEQEKCENKDDKATSADTVKGTDKK